MYKLLILVFFCSFLSLSQEGTQFGFKVNAGWKLNTHRSKTTGIRSAENGYGFSFGVPVRFWRTETSSIDTGIEYGYTSFDQYASGQLQISQRFHSVGIPILYNSKLSKNWFWQAGGGFNYNFLAQAWQLGFSQNVNEFANGFQPYLMGGITSLAERGNHFFEFGIQARYFFLDLWKRETLCLKRRQINYLSSTLC